MHFHMAILDDMWYDVRVSGMDRFRCELRPCTYETPCDPGSLIHDLYLPWDLPFIEIRAGSSCGGGMPPSSLH